MPKNKTQNKSIQTAGNGATRKLLFVFYHVVVLKQRFDGEKFCFETICGSMYFCCSLSTL
jgi:hypothetical protein